MNALRWMLLAGTALAAGGFVVLWLLADGFRRSFGASANGSWTAVLPLAAMLLFLTALLLPGQRVLLHGVALLALLLTGASAWLLQESSFMGSLGLLYASAWLAWYWHSVWR